jgi:hypothetical protein
MRPPSRRDLLYPASAWAGSPNQQRPPTGNERKGGSEQNEKIRRSNLAGDQDTDEPVETEEG